MQISNNTPMLSIDPKLEPDESFSLDGGTFSCSPTGMSFSSASSIHGPFTPTSGPTTPASRAGSNEFDMSFMSDDLPYDVTPPSSHGSVDSYFQVELAKSCPGMDMDLDSMTPDGMPATPTRFDGILDHTIGSQSCFNATQMTPPQPLGNMYALSDSLISPPFMFPTPEQQHALATASIGAAMADRTDMWASICESDDSPIDLFPINPVVPSNGNSRLSKPYRTSGDLLSPAPPLNFNSNPAAAPSVSRQLFVGGAQQKTNTLQKHLNEQCHGFAIPQLRSQPLPGSCKKSFDGVGKISRRVRVPENLPVGHVPRGRFRCPHGNCENRVYVRMEHLKRHISTHHTDCHVYKCEFCKKEIKGRKDNFKAHILLHCNTNSTSPRTKFFPKAATVLARLKGEERPRKTKGRAGKQQAGGEFPSTAAVKAVQAALAAGL